MLFSPPCPPDSGAALDLGVYVSSISPSSSFERAGVQCGDIIVQVRPQWGGAEGVW